MIRNFDYGRSRSFFCRAAVLLGLADLENSLDSAKQKLKTDNVKPDDKKTKAEILRDILDEFAVKDAVELKLKK